MSKLQCKVALVTGASKGIGAGIARELAAAGAAVVVNYASDRTGAESVVDAIIAGGGCAIAIQADVSKSADVAELFERAKEAFGSRFPLHVISAERGDGLPELRKALYDVLGVIRVYTKQPGKPADMTNPFTVPVGSTVANVAGKVHRDLEETVKSFEKVVAHFQGKR